MPAAVIRRDRVAGRRDAGEEGQHGQLLGGHGAQAQGRLGDDAERALRADEEVRQVVAGHVLDRPTAGPDDAAVREHDLEAEDGVAGDAVLHAAQAAGVLGQVAADGADLEAGRVRGIEQAMLRSRTSEVGVDDAGLDDRRQVAGVDLEDAIHLRGHQGQCPVDRRGATGQPAARPARHDGHAVAGGQGDDGRDLGRRSRHRHRQRPAGIGVLGLVVAEGRRVRSIDRQVGRSGSALATRAAQEVAASAASV